MTFKELTKLIDPPDPPMTEAEAEEIATWETTPHHSSPAYWRRLWAMEREAEDDDEEGTPIKLKLAEIPRTIRPEISDDYEVRYKEGAKPCKHLGSDTDMVIINMDKAHRFMLECYPMGQIDTFTTDKVAYERALKAAIKTTKFTVGRDVLFNYHTGQIEKGWIFELYAIDFMAAFEAAWAATKKGVKPRQHREKPEPSKVLTLVGDTQISITAKNYQYALTSKPNPYAYIQVMPESFFTKAKWSKKGTLENDVPEEEATGEPYDLPLLTQIFTALFAASRETTRYTITVYLPDFCANMDIDFNKGNANDILAKVETFDKLVGIVDNGGMRFKVLQVIAYDEEKQLLTLAVPYMLYVLNQIQNAMKGDKRYKKKLAQGTDPDIIPGYYSWLVHADIVNERNKVGAALAYRIIAHLLQRGAHKTNENGETVYHKRFSELIEEVPELVDRLENTKAAADKNRVMRRAFTGAYSILKNKTDVYKYFVGLNIPATIPTITTAENVLVITHKGRNAKFTGTIPYSK